MTPTSAYQYLLRLLPRHVRRNYGDEMTTVFQERLREKPGPMLWAGEAFSMIAAAFRTRIVENLVMDLRAAFRIYARNPSFAIVAVLLLSMGVGSFTAMYSMLDAWVLSPLPYRDPGRLAYLLSTNSKSGWTLTVSPADFADWKNDPSYESMSAWDSASYNLTGSGEPERLVGARVSANFFRTLGVGPVAGRDFFDGEDKPGAGRVVILSHELWESRFLSDPRLVGKTIELDNEQVTVAGILPPHFQFPLMGKTQVFTPLAMTLAERADRAHLGLQVLARTKPGISPAQAALSLESLNKSLAAKYPDTNATRGFYSNDLASEIGKHQGNSVIWAVFAITFFLLLLVCSNIAALMLSRSMERQKEVAVRFAMGASRARVIRQLLTEHAILFVAGGAGGIAVAMVTASWIGNSIPWSNRVYLVNFGQVPVHPGALLFALVTALLAGLVFGLAPALEGSRLNLNAVLTEGAGRSSPSRRGRILRDVLVGGEIAMAMVMLISTGLLVKSLHKIWSMDVGFRPDHLTSVVVGLPPKAYADLPKAERTLAEIAEKLAAMPGVEASGATEHIPFGDTNSRTPFWIDGRPAPLPGEIPTSQIAGVNPDYFSAVGMSLLSGRGFSRADDEHAPPVAVINEVFARREWPNESPVGRHIRVGNKDARLVEIVGIVKPVRMYGFQTSLEQQMYVPMKQRPVRRAYFAIRSGRDAGELGSAVRSAVWAIDPNVPVPELTTMTTSISEGYTPHTLTTQWMTLFSVLALVLSAVGLYAMMARTVAQRSREIGIRLALGARTVDILGTVVRRGAIVSAIGAAIGVAGAAATTQSLSLILYDISPRDPETFLSVAAALMAVALIACYLPARRASKLDPAMALRHE